MKNFAQRKTAPEDVETFILTALLNGDYSPSTDRAYPMLRELFGLDADKVRWNGAGDELDKIAQQVTTPKRSLVVTAALILAEWEEHADTDTWRHPGGKTGRYLTQMQTWGYELSDLEKEAAGIDVEPTTDSDRPGAA